MGKWGGVFKRGKWDCDGYLGQSDDFVKGVKNGEVEWGYSGQHTDSIKDGIPVAHVQWLMGYLGKLSDTQIPRRVAGQRRVSERGGMFRARGQNAHFEASVAGSLRAPPPHRSIR